MVRNPLQGGVGIDEIGRRCRMPRTDVGLLPREGRELAASFGEHFGRRIDAGDFGIGEGVREEAGQVAGAATEVVD
jgi:hypothetical protein